MKLFLLNLLVVVVLCIPFFAYYLYECHFYNDLEDKMSSGYCIYLDGDSVDSSSICIRNYDLSHISVDDESYCIYIGS